MTKELVNSFAALPGYTASQIIQMQDVNGNTPLHFSAYHFLIYKFFYLLIICYYFLLTSLRYGGHFETVKFLLEKGASPFIRNKHDKTPLMDILETLPKLTDASMHNMVVVSYANINYIVGIIQNITFCKSILEDKCRELDQISKKNMQELTGVSIDDTNKKQNTKQKTKPKKPKKSTTKKSNEQTDSNDPSEDNEQNTDEEETPSIPEISPPLLDKQSTHQPHNQPTNPPNQPPNQSRNQPQKTIPAPNSISEPPRKPVLSSSPPFPTISVPQTKPISTAPTITPAPAPQKPITSTTSKPLPYNTRQPSFESVLKANLPSNTPALIPPTQNKEHTAPPVATTHTAPTPSFSPSPVPSPLRPRVNSPIRSDPNDPNSVLDQVLVRLGNIDYTTSSPEYLHPLESMYKDFNDMNAALATVNQFYEVITVFRLTLWFRYTRTL